MVFLNLSLGPAEDLPPDKIVINKFLADNMPGFSNLSYPDLVPGSQKKIDAACSWNGKEYAIEHTTLVRFEEERTSKEQFKEIKDGLTELGKVFPPGNFTVLMSCRDYGGKAHRAKLIKGIFEWIPKMAADLIPGRGFPLNVAIEGVPVFVYRWKMEGNRVELKQFNPESKVQYPCTGTKLISKIEKLKSYKQKNYRTLLLIESSRRDDEAQMIVDPLMKFEGENGQVVDELHFVNIASISIPYMSVDLASYRSRKYF